MRPPNLQAGSLKSPSAERFACLEFGGRPWDGANTRARRVMNLSLGEAPLHLAALGCQAFAWKRGVRANWYSPRVGVWAADKMRVRIFPTLVLGCLSAHFLQ